MCEILKQNNFVSRFICSSPPVSMNVAHISLETDMFGEKFSIAKDSFAGNRIVLDKMQMTFVAIRSGIL